MSASVREARPDDLPAILDVLRLAFETPAEAGLVEALVADGSDAVSVVAEADGRLVGHVLCSPVTIEGAEAMRILSLAPVAVVPDRQNEGIGSELVREALAAAVRGRWDAVVVLGHPDYYPRFGFEQAMPRGIDPPWDDIPSEAWMVLELRAGCLEGVEGIVRFPTVFDGV